MRQRFTKTETGIKHDTIGLDARLKTACKLLLQIHANLGHHIDILRRLLHRTRLTPHVHDTHRAIAITYRRERFRMPQARNIIDHRCTGSQRRPHHRRFVGIHRNRHSPAGNALQQGQEATQFFRLRRRNGARTRGLGTDIENIRPRLELIPGMINRPLQITNQTIAGKRIRRQIDYPHDQGTLQG